MPDLYAFNRNLLNEKLPFSISRRKGTFHREIDGLLIAFAASKHLWHGEGIDFLSYSYATLENVDNWILSRLKGFFFWGDDPNRKILLSYYYYYRMKAGGESEGNNAQVVAALFLDDTSFRVGMVEDGQPEFVPEDEIQAYRITIPWATFLKSTNSTSTPKKQFQIALDEFIDEVNSNLGHSDHSLLVEEIPEGSHAYDSENRFSDLDAFEATRIGAAHRKLYERAFDSTGRDALVANLTAQVLDHARKQPWRMLNDSKPITAWVARLPSIAVFSMFTEGWTEYMPAICGHMDFPNGQRQLRNLGSLVFGYKHDNLVPPETRAYLRMVSVRVSSVVAGSVIEDELQRSHDYALASAITQVLARNYAHHIGAHIKLRTTPKAIKDRLKELYKGQFEDL